MTNVESMNRYEYEEKLAILMNVCKTEREARRELNRGTYVMELQSFIDDNPELSELFNALEECDE